MIKIFRKEDYNYIFNKVNGYFCRWGKNFDDDPDFCKYGVEIADIEISSGGCSGRCGYCYKSNNVMYDKKFMNLELYKKVFDILSYNNVLTQVAFGITDVFSNPFMKDIFEYTRKNDVIPNITINGIGMNDYYYDLLSDYCGAIAVSYHNNFDICVNTVNNLIKRNKQVNIHYVLAKETYNLDLIKNLYNSCEGLNAIVFLMLKKKGFTNNYNSITYEELKNLINFCYENKIVFGFDSCAGNFVANILKEKNIDITFVEPCESSLFSVYVNVDGIAYPCSFLEEVVEGVDLKYIDSFDDLWFSEIFVNFREKLLQKKRECLYYKII